MNKLEIRVSQNLAKCQGWKEERIGVNVHVCIVKENGCESEQLQANMRQTHAIFNV